MPLCVFKDQQNTYVHKILSLFDTSLFSNWFTNFMTSYSSCLPRRCINIMHIYNTKAHMTLRDSYLKAHMTLQFHIKYMCFLFNKLTKCSLLYHTKSKFPVLLLLFLLLLLMVLLLTMWLPLFKKPFKMEYACFCSLAVCSGELGYVTCPVLSCHDFCEKGSIVCCFRDWRASYFACHRDKEKSLKIIQWEH